MTVRPWDWRPDAGAWAAALIDKAGGWQPIPSLKLDTDRICAAIVDGATAASPWLRHPLVSRLTKPKPEDSSRDVALAAWTAANTASELGTVEFAEQVVLWTGAGDIVLDAGRHDLETLGALVSQPAPVPVGLDLWCRATGMVTAGSWPALQPSVLAEREPEIEASVGGYLRTMALLAHRCPQLTSWITTATAVVRPLVPLSDAARSSHDPDIPGLVEADISGGRAQTIELVVHETAHHHLRMAQVAANLVDPADDARYRSPLRAEPRPLLGVLLAYHALAYICAALVEAAAAGIVAPEVMRAALTDLGRDRDDARAVLQRADSRLTDAGVDFVLHTDRVTEHVAA